MPKIAEDHVNQIARRLHHEGVKPGGHHCSIVRYSADIAFQIIFTRKGKVARLETVWTFDGPKRSAATNKRRGDACEKKLAAAAPPAPLHRCDTEVYAYVGFVFAVPAAPDDAFYDDVAKKAAWARDHVKPSELYAVKEDCVMSRGMT